VLSLAYVILYFSIFSVRYCRGIITKDMVIKRTFPWIDYKFVIMGLMVSLSFSLRCFLLKSVDLFALQDATGQILGIYAAREISGFFLTLLSQGQIPMTMIITAVLLKARYNLGQIAGVLILITGVIVTLIPDMVDGNVCKKRGKCVTILITLV